MRNVSGKLALISPMHREERTPNIVISDGALERWSGWKGENVATTEVAEVVGQHPDVAEANIYGVRTTHLNPPQRLWHMPYLPLTHM